MIYLSQQNCLCNCMACSHIQDYLVAIFEISSLWWAYHVLLLVVIYEEIYPCDITLYYSINNIKLKLLYSLLFNTTLTNMGKYYTRSKARKERSKSVCKASFIDIIILLFHSSLYQLRNISLKLPYLTNMFLLTKETVGWEYPSKWTQ